MFGRLKNLLVSKPPVAPSPAVTVLTPGAIMAQAESLINTAQKPEAIAWLEAHAFDADNGHEPLVLLYQLYLDTQDHEQADETLLVGQSLFADSPEFLTYCGEQTLAKADTANAERIFTSALSIATAHYGCYLGLSKIRFFQERYQEALEYCEHALSLAPDSKEVLKHKASLLYYNGKHRESLALADYCADILHIHGVRPSLTGYANHLFLGEFESASATLDKLLSITPEDPALHYAYSHLLLLQHNFSQGWENYRFRLQATVDSYRPIPLPEWQGEELNGRSILITIEQGLGDQIMFASCLPDVLAMKPAHLYLEAHTRLAPLFQRSFPQITVIATTQTQQFSWLEQARQAECHTQLGDLPRLFRSDTAAFLSQQSPYLTPCPQKVLAWKQQLQDKQGRLKIGFAWKGGTEKTRSHVRSLKLADFTPLFNLGEATWVSLQYGSTPSDQATAPAMPADSSLFFPEAVGQDLDDFAALVSSLDLVITACNTTVHMAGALGIPCWVLTPKIPEWRYGLTNSMPWYPSVSLFRQHAEGDWEEVLHALCVSLEAAFRQNSTISPNP